MDYSLLEIGGRVKVRRKLCVVKSVNHTGRSVEVVDVIAGTTITARYSEIEPEFTRYYFQNAVSCGNCNGAGLQGYMDYCRACQGTGIEDLREFMRNNSKGDQIYLPIAYKAALKEMMKQRITDAVNA